MSDRFITADQGADAQFLPVWQVQAVASGFQPSRLSAMFATKQEGGYGASDFLDDEHDALNDGGANPSEPSIESQIAEAYHRGVADGQQAVIDTAELDAISADRLASAIENLKPILSDTICTTLMRTMQALLESSSGFQHSDEAMLRQHIETLAKLVTRDMSAAALNLHPDDLALLAATQSGLATSEFGLSLNADDSLRRGTVCLTHNDGWIEQGTQPLLDELKNLLDQIEGGQ